MHLKIPIVSKLKIYSFIFYLDFIVGYKHIIYSSQKKKKKLILKSNYSIGRADISRHLSTVIYLEITYYLLLVQE